MITCLLKFSQQNIFHQITRFCTQCHFNVTYFVLPHTGGAGGKMMTLELEVRGSNPGGKVLHNVFFFFSIVYLLHNSDVKYRAGALDPKEATLYSCIYSINSIPFLHLFYCMYMYIKQTQY